MCVVLGVLDAFRYEISLNIEALGNSEISEFCRGGRVGKSIAIMVTALCAEPNEH